jgi:hypothetical protein
LETEESVLTSFLLSLHRRPLGNGRKLQRLLSVPLRTGHHGGFRLQILQTVFLESYQQGTLGKVAVLSE